MCNFQKEVDEFYDKMKSHPSYETYLKCKENIDRINQLNEFLERHKKIEEDLERAKIKKRGYELRTVYSTNSQREEL